MDNNKTSSATAPPAAAAGADAHAQWQPPEQEVAARIHSACGACLRVAAAALVGYSLATAAWRARHDPPELAFVVAAFLLLAVLLACIRRAERLTPDSPAGDRRQLQAAVWFLSAVLSCGFAYRVAAIMPPAMAVAVWCMTAFVVLPGLCLLVLCRDQQYQALEGADAAGDTNAYVKISTCDELV